MKKLMRAAVVGAGILAFAAPGWGQYGTRKKEEPGEKPRLVARVEPHDWTMTVTVNLRPQTFTNGVSGMPERTAFDFTSAAVVFPLAKESATHMLRVPDRDIEGRLRLNDRVVMEHPSEILSDFPAGTKLGKWALQGWTGEEVELEIKIPVTSWQTILDEAAAKTIKWPEAGGWGSAQSALEPEYFIEKAFDGPYDMAPVTDLVKKWTSGKDPRSIPPIQLAKFLCGEVLKYVQTSGNGLTFARTGQMEGVELLGAPETARTGRGSEWDMVCLLVAVYRQVGLPARCVIGYDVGKAKGRDNEFLTKKDSMTLRAWVEFAVIDPRQDDPVTWVPVDVVRLRKSSSRPPPLDKPWPFFGTHKESDGVIPFAYQFFPPVKGVVSHGSPAFFGWMVTPAPPKDVIQALRFMAVTTPKRGGEDKKDKDDKKKPFGK